MRDHDSPLAGTEVHYLASEHVSDEFKVVVGHCPSPDSNETSVIYLGDEFLTFGMAMNIVRTLQFVHIPRGFLVVGMGYRTTDIEEIGLLRARDFTPSVDLNWYDDPEMMGGAAAFLSFLRDELKPWVGERFDVDADDSMFFGNSDGGTFATYALLTEPATFRRWGIGSPTLEWGDGEAFRREEAYASAHTDLPAKAFFSVGEYENTLGVERYRAQLPAAERPDWPAFDHARTPSASSRCCAAVTTRVSRSSTSASPASSTTPFHRSTSRVRCATSATRRIDAATMRYSS